KEGSLWIGSEGGLSRYKDGKFTNFTVKNGLGNNNVKAICEDQQGTLRMATARGLSSLNPEGKISTMNLAAGTVDNALQGVCQDSQGDLWVSSNEGLTRLSERESVPREGVEREGGVRFPRSEARRSQGLDALTLGRYGINEGLPDKLATALCTDRSGRVWVGTY